MITYFLVVSYLATACAPAAHCIPNHVEIEPRASLEQCESDAHAINMRAQAMHDTFTLVVTCVQMHDETGRPAALPPELGPELGLDDQEEP